MTVYGSFCETVSTFPENTFLCVPAYQNRAYYPDGIEFSYKTAWVEVERLKEIYQRSGYGSGHRIAYLLENRPEYLFHFLAANALGISVVPINPDYLHDEMLYQMDHSEADMIVTIASRSEDLKAVTAESPKRPPLVIFEDLPELLPRPQTVAEDIIPNLQSEVSLLGSSPLC